MLHTVKVRRVGNSNVVTLPQHLESSGFIPGTSVVIEETGAGALILHHEDRVRERVRAIGRQVIEEDREALDMLAAYDRGEGADAMNGSEDVRSRQTAPTHGE